MSSASTAEKKQKLMAEKKNLEDFQKKVELTGDVERFWFDLKPGQYPDSRAMPSVVTFQIEFDDELDEAPGIRKWLQCFLLPVIMGMASALLALIRNDMRELQRPCRRKEEVIQSRWKQGTYKREGTERRGRI